MPYEHLTTQESMRIQRAHSQALYYAQRGFHDAVRIYLPTLAPKDRAVLTGVVGDFLTAYVIAELSIVIGEAARRMAGESGLTRALPLADTAVDTHTHSQPEVISL